MFRLFAERSSQLVDIVIGVRTSLFRPFQAERGLFVLTTIMINTRQRAERPHAIRPVDERFSSRGDRLL